MNNGHTDLKNGKRERYELPDRSPPHSYDAERAVLGSILMSPNDCLPEAIMRLPMGADVFYDLRNAEIYKTMLELYEDREPIDLVSMRMRLIAWNKFENIGGMPYINGLDDVCPTPVHIAHYCQQVVLFWTLRSHLRICQEVEAKVYELGPAQDIVEFVDEVEAKILKLSRSNTSTEDVPIKELVISAIDQISASHAREGGIDGISTGLIDLDRMTGGMHPAEMIVIAARPSLGKTSLAMNIVEHVALVEKLPVGVFSLEMTGTQLIKRMLCSHARVNLKAVRDGYLVERDFPKLTHAAGKISKAQIYLDETSSAPLTHIRSKLRRWVQQYGIKLAVIDYLQLATTGSKRRAESRQQEVSELSAGIKGIAKELGIPIIVLSQLNRDVEREKGRKPRMSDLRESGAIEQDADVIGFLYKPVGDDDEEMIGQEAVPVNLLIAKLRNGDPGEVPLTFLKPFTRFESAARIDPADVPQQQYRNPHND